MKNSLGLLIVVSCLAALAARRIRRAGDDDGDTFLDPTANRNETKTCITKGGKEGQCFHESMCSVEDGDPLFEKGGIIDDIEIRRKETPCNVNAFEWCCAVEDLKTDNTSTTTTTTSTSTVRPDRANIPAAGCRNAQKESCPWCVALYRDKGNPRTKSPSGLFCGGAIVGNKAVLTSAACIMSATTSELWVRLPGHTRDYMVVNRIKHPDYRSGTGEHDMGLLVLGEDIVWPESDGLGACLGLKTPLKGDCVAIGFDNSDKIKFTPMSVTGSSCTEQGSTYDAACGRTTGFCSVIQGAPVLCPSDTEGLIVAGVVRQSCIKDSVLLGSLEPSADWARETLKNNAVPASSYTTV